MIVETDRLTHRYGSRVALDALSFAVREGEIYGLLGPNGSGKSTLFSILSTLLAPTGGTAKINGHDVLRQPALVRQFIGVVFQSQSLDRKLTVHENLVAQGHLFGLSGARLRERIAFAMDRLSLDERRNDLIGTLSGGWKRRVEIAKALLHRPRLLLLDEPSTGLDPAARLDLAKNLADLRAGEGVTVLLTTHILDEADRCDRLLLLHEGRRIAEGTPQELKAEVGGDIVILGVDDPDSMRDRLAERFQVPVQSLDGALRIEIANAHRFVAEVVEAFPGSITSVAFHKPTLEDAFLDRTGAAL